MITKFTEPCDYVKVSNISISGGVYGSIYGISPKSDSSKQYAYKLLKTIDRKLHPNLVEIDIMFSIDSPYIVKGIDTLGYGHCDRRSPAIVMELANGTLYDLLSSEKITFEERMTAAVHILKGMLCLHMNGYLHLDMKPENVLCFEVDGVKHFKIADFGLSSYGTFIDTTHMRITNWYRPPESFVQPQQYEQLSDVYSVGMIFVGLFKMRDGKRFLPFNSIDDNPVYRQHLAYFGRTRDDTLERWISPTIPAEERKQLISLISAMLSPLKGRPRIEDVLAHPVWSKYDDKTPVGSKIIDPYIIITHYSELTHRYLLKLVELTKNKNYSILSAGFIFLTIDIFLRVIACCGPALTEAELDIFNLFSLRTSCKFYQWEISRGVDGSIVSQVDLLEMEFLRMVVKHKISQDQIYCNAQYIEHLVRFYKEIILNPEECKNYLRINPEALFASYGPGVRKLVDITVGAFWKAVQHSK